MTPQCPNRNDGRKVIASKDFLRGDLFEQTSDGISTNLFRLGFLVIDQVKIDIIPMKSNCHCALFRIAKVDGEEVGIDSVTTVMLILNGNFSRDT